MRRLLLCVCIVAGLLSTRAGAVWVDPCKPYVGQIQALQAKIAATKKQLQDLPDTPNYDIKAAQLQAEIATYQQNLGILQNTYAQCQANNPPPSPAPSVPPFEPSTNAPDPQLAVGKDYVVSVDTSNVAFYPRNADGSLDVANVNTMTSNHLFDTVMTLMNQRSGSLDSPISCRLSQGLGCIREAYDTRVFYDSKRDRFWIAAALRPLLWKCDPDSPLDPDPNHLTGYFTQRPTPSLVQTCHAGHGDEVHRYIAVAVTKGFAQSEYPDFYTSVLVDEYADWPQMTIAKDWLILNHRGETSVGLSDVRFFDANSLANGDGDDSIMQTPSHVFHPDAFNTDAYDWTNNDHKSVTLSTAIYLTTVHGASDGVEYLVGGYDHYLIVYGFKAPTGNPTGRPVMLHPAAVKIGDNRFVYNASSPPVWRHGTLYYAYETCANDQCPAGARLFIRLLKVPVHHAQSGNHGVWASSNPAKGYRDPSIGTSPGDELWYSRPVMDVTANDDLVMGFSRTGRRDSSQYPSVRYSVLYHHANRFSQSQSVAVGELLPVDDSSKPVYPWAGGVIDLGGAGIDPRHGFQVWISHAYASLTNSGYRAVITAIVP